MSVPVPEPIDHNHRQLSPLAVQAEALTASAVLVRAENLGPLEGSTDDRYSNLPRSVSEFTHFSGQFGSCFFFFLLLFCCCCCFLLLFFFFCIGTIQNALVMYR